MEMMHKVCLVYYAFTQTSKRLKNKVGRIRSHKHIQHFPVLRKQKTKRKRMHSRSKSQRVL